MSKREERESIWSVQKRVRNFYGVLFSTLLVAGTIYLVTQKTTFLDFLPLFGVLVVGVAAVSMVVADVLGGIMGIADLVQDWRQKRIEAARREGEKRGAEKLQQALDEWEAQNRQGDRPTAETIDYR